MLLQNSPKLVSVAIAAKAKEKNAKWENRKKCEKVAHSINQREFVVRLKCAYGISFNYTWQIHTYIHLYPQMVGIQMELYKYLLHIFIARMSIQIYTHMKTHSGNTLNSKGSKLEYTRSTRKENQLNEIY